ncbi:MAG: rubrerythrin family protein [Anaerolineaceae bacterium]|nr:rubrerythrin family protein [Anaerolineaceae bacterium]
MSKVIDDLNEAISGESQANQHYLAFARKAAEEGYTQIAKLFRAVAKAEEIHSYNHMVASGYIKDTVENLKTAIAGENYEHSEMYPAFIEDAKAEDHKKAKLSFRWAQKVEVVHEEIYKEALASLDKEIKAFDYYVCPKCGHTHPRTRPERCPVCGISGAEYMQY